MSGDSRTLPQPSATMVDRNGKVTPEFFRFFRSTFTQLQSQIDQAQTLIEQLQVQQAAITAIFSELTVIDGQIQGLGPLAVLEPTGAASDANFLRGDGAYANSLNGPLGLQSYAVASLPAPDTGALIYVTDEAGGPVPAFSDGTNWRRVTDRAIVS